MQDGRKEGRIGEGLGSIAGAARLGCSVGLDTGRRGSPLEEVEWSKGLSLRQVSYGMDRGDSIRGCRTAAKGSVEVFP